VARQGTALRMRAVDLALIASVAALPVQDLESAPLKIVIITDWHVNPIYNASLSSKCRCTQWPGDPADPGCELQSPASSYGQYSCDAPQELFVSSLQGASAAMPSPDMVLVLGDLVTHDSPSAEFTHKTFREMSEQISAVFANKPMACQTPLGNNDAFPNYGINNSDPLFYLPQATTAKEFCGMTADEAQVFTAKGYYSRQVRPRDRLLVLNTNLYARANAAAKTNEQHLPPGVQRRLASTQGRPGARMLETLDPAQDADPLDQFAWMRGHFEWAKHNKGRIYIAGHVPPALDSFNRAHQWQPAYANSYWDLIANYSDVLGAHLFGHLHSAEIRATNDQRAAHAPALQILSSVSPIYASNPSFYTLLVQPVTREINLTMHSFDLGALQPGETPVYVPMPSRPLDQRAGLVATNERYLKLFETLLAPTLDSSSTAQFEALFNQYKGGYHGKGLECTATNSTFQDCSTCSFCCRVSFVCLQAHGTSEDDYDKCVKEHQA